MIDLESEIGAYLRQRAEAVDVRPDLAEVTSLGSGMSAGRPQVHRVRLLAFCGAAAALVIAAVLVVAGGVPGRHHVRVTTVPPAMTAPSPTVPVSTSVPTTDAVVPVVPPTIESPTTETPITESPSPSTTATPRRALPGNGVIIAWNSTRFEQADTRGLGLFVILPANLTDGQSPHSEAPVWAPDGRRIAYALGTTINVGDTTSGAVTEIGQCGNGFSCVMAWSPDGSTIAVGGTGSITFLDPAGPPDQIGTSIEVETGGGTISELSWTPDSATLIFVSRTAFDSGASASAIDRNGTHQRIIAPSRHSGWLDYYDLALSPDGSTLAWIGGQPPPESGQEDSTLQLMAMNLDGTNVRVLRDVGSCSCIGYSPGLTWSPDGRQLAMALPAPAFNGFYVFLAEADGTNLRRMGIGGSGTPGWQPVPNG